MDSSCTARVPRRELVEFIGSSFVEEFVMKQVNSTETLGRMPVTVLSGFLGAGKNNTSESHPRELRRFAGGSYCERYERSQY